MILTKEAHKVQKTFDCSRKILPSSYFNRLLSLRVYKILAENVYTEELCLMTLKFDAKFEEKLICCFKNDRILVNFDLSTWSRKKCKKICTFIGSYCAKYLMFDLKKYRWVTFHDTEEWWKKNWLAVWKMIWGIW